VKYRSNPNIADAALGCAALGMCAAGKQLCPAIRFVAIDSLLGFRLAPAKLLSCIRFEICTMASNYSDNSLRYGFISRALHWSMALILGWQFLTTVVRVLLEESALDEFMWGTHKAAGVVLMLLILLRVGWALHSRKRRPASLGLAASLGHIALYGLMFCVPLFALLRQYGSGRELSVFGLQLMPGFAGEKIEWLMLPANLFHGWGGWLLLLLIAGHVLMTFAHRRQGQDILPRMLG
jgi:cytochrome b561